MFRTQCFVILATIGLTSSSELHAQTGQELVNAITKAAHAYWNQRVVIHHPQRTFYGYSGSQTVVAAEDQSDRCYASDSGWIPEPHTA